MKQFTLAKIALSVLALTIFTGCGVQETQVIFDKTIDEATFNHLYQIADVIEEYKGKTGKYPLADQREALKKDDGSFKDELSEKLYKQEQVECIITPRELPAFVKNRQGVFLRVSYDILNKELSKGLGREIKLPFDPQEKIVYKPNFYVYQYNKGNYYLSVHLNEAAENAVKVGNYNFKLTVTSAKGVKGIPCYLDLKAKNGGQLPEPAEGVPAPPQIPAQ